MSSWHHFDVGRRKLAVGYGLFSCMNTKSAARRQDHIALRMQADEDELVTVRRQRYDSGKTARVSLADLKDIHFRLDGRRCAAVGELAKVGPRLCLHARVRCDRIVDGKLHHFCRYGPPPHEMLVFIIQKDNDSQLYRRLLERVETPRARRRKRTGTRARPASRRLARLLREIAN
jgi:hypothetical protein